MPGSNKFCEKIAKLFALLGSDNAGERENARVKLDALLRRHKKTWNDLPELLQPDPARDDPDDTSAPGAGATEIGPVDLVHHLLRRYLALKPYEYVGIALWIVHTHVFSRFVITPRLALTSPVRGCGKTTALAIAELLVARARKSDGITAASIYHLVDQEHPTLLVDEVDNLGLPSNGSLRAVLNSGHRRGGSITRYINNQARSFSTFAPMALAAIGTLPLPIVHRSLVIHMERHDGWQPLQRFHPDNARTMIDMGTAYRNVFDWARTVTLDPDPEMPAELRNRAADSWRPLISIADACGWGADAREAALEFNRDYHDEDAGVVLLRDLRDIFDLRKTDRLASVTLVEDLNGLDDSLWSSWNGSRLSQGELARLLLPFRIRSRSIWPLQRDGSSRSRKGYFKAQFEAAWRSYCSETGTPAHRSSPKHLRSA